MNNVVWKDVKGYEGIYQISNYGEVKALEIKRINGKNSFYTKKEQILKKTKTTTGYYKVELTKDKKRKSFKVHRLVAIAFIPNPMNKPNVNHIDGKVLNNYVENLNWCTQKENMIHANVFNLRKKKISKEQELEIIKMYLSKTQTNQISKKFNVSKPTVLKILKKYNIKLLSLSEKKIVYVIDVEELKDKLKNNTQKSIAKEIGCDASLISHYSKRLLKTGGIYNVK